MRKGTWVVLGTLLLLGLSPAAGQPETSPPSDDLELPVADRPWEVIDLAIALDTSTSMDDLIEAARLKLWEIVNGLLLAEPVPTIRLALLSYGNFDSPREAGWVRVEADFTSDLDLVSERLFELESRGATEYVGRVLETALGELSWTRSDEALKLLFVAGNEPADQDPAVDLVSVAEEIRSRDIFLGAVFCGKAENEAAETWRRLAELAEGEFAAIDHRGGTVVVATPADGDLAELSRAMTRTFIPLGEDGSESVERIVEQDRRTAELSLSAAAGRAETKAHRRYSEDWDLVDAVDAGRLELLELPDADLPPEMRAMSPEDRHTYIAAVAARREELRQRIRELAAERRRFIAERIEQEGLDPSRSFDAAIQSALARRLEERGFEIP